MSSFTKRKQTNFLKGTRKSLHSGQVITSTGNPSLDNIIGGGIPLGSLLLIEEDSFITYSRVLAKYFLAEGVVSEQSVFVGCLDVDPKSIIEKLPKPVNEESSGLSEDLKENNRSGILENTSSAPIDNMRIAWRYNELPKVNSDQSGNKIGHNFNLLEHMSKDCLNNVDLHVWTIDNFNSNSENDKNKSFYSKNYFNILDKISSTIHNEKFNIDPTSDSQKSILRICLPSFGSPMWYDDNFNRDILKFLTVLKSLVRNSLAVCLITMPTFLFQKYDEHLVDRIRSIVDISIELESFAGSTKATNPLFKDYNGIFHIRKMSAVNTLAVYSPETTDLAFKLRRKKFVIEKLHLPPELQASEEGDAISSTGCGSTTNSHLDF